jgi:hypothetical protein
MNPDDLKAYFSWMPEHHFIHSSHSLSSVQSIEAICRIWREYGETAAQAMLLDDEG